jgi:hypothetical protein
MEKLEQRPKHCSDCMFIKSLKEPVDLWFDGSKQWYCTQGHLKVWDYEKACPWGLKEEPKK